MARALLFAHERGIVHRDIKPDNVLLSGEAAVVTDFGIAKAISVAQTASDAATNVFTQLGTSIGTPAYMAPEQAAGDPNIDHRADIYAFGCLAFELLTGVPPFHGLPPHQIMAAHLGTVPPTVASKRDGVSAELDSLVTACLFKNSTDRPASAREIIERLERAATVSRESPAPAIKGRQFTLAQALLVWGASFAATWVLARAAVVGIGLPSWTVLLATSVAALGLPAVLVTWWVNDTARRAMLQTPTLTPGGTAVRSTKASMALRAVEHVSWGRTWKAGAVAGILVVLAVTVVMVLRQFGLGPVASLMAAGRIDADARLLVADFQSTAADTTLGDVTAQAVRTSLGQSQAIALVSPADISRGLRRMTLPTSTRLTDSVAHTLAIRENIPLVLTGQISTIGNGFLLSARLVTGDSVGEPLAEFQEGADGPSDLLNAIDKLAGDIRARIGESFRSVQQSTPLYLVTTSSLAALREYSLAMRLGDRQGDFVEGHKHLLAAVREDSTFAMAWRRLSVSAGNLSLPLSQQLAPAAAAYRFRDRLPPDERDVVEARYLDITNSAAAIRKYATTPHLRDQWLNYEVELRQVGDFAAAESVSVFRFARAESAQVVNNVQTFSNRIIALTALGRIDGAQQVLGRMRTHYANAPATGLSSFEVGWALGLDSAAAAVAPLQQSGNQSARLIAAVGEAAIVGARGQLRRSLVMSQLAQAAAESAGGVTVGSQGLRTQIVAQAIHSHRDQRGVERIDSLASERGELRLPLLDQGLLDDAISFAQLGRVDRAIQLIENFEKRATSVERQALWTAFQGARGEAALASNRAADALAAFRLSVNPDSGSIAFNSLYWVRIARALPPGDAR